MNRQKDTNAVFETFEEALEKLMESWSPQEAMDNLPKIFADEEITRLIRSIAEVFESQFPGHIAIWDTYYPLYTADTHSKFQHLVQELVEKHIRAFFADRQSNTTRHFQEDLCKAYGLAFIRHMPEAVATVAKT